MVRNVNCHTYWLEISGVCTVGRIIRDDLWSALYLHKVTFPDTLCALESADEFPYCHFRARLRTAFWFMHKVPHTSETFTCRWSAMDEDIFQVTISCTPLRELCFLDVKLPSFFYHPPMAQSSSLHNKEGSKEEDSEPCLLLVPVVFSLHKNTTHAPDATELWGRTSKLCTRFNGTFFSVYWSLFFSVLSFLFVSKEMCNGNFPGACM